LAGVVEDICLASALTQAAAIRDRRISSRELLELYLRRIDRLNPTLNAVVTLDVERATEAAKAADAATMATGGSGDGRPVGTGSRLAEYGRLPPLHGLPITVKDAIETAGLRSTGGARELVDHVPTSDAPAVARLKAAGAIVFGKTNVPQWSNDIQTFNDLFGVTNNPWDVTRTSGGSSGGAAVAVATGLTSFELGTDIGGSVRIPSSYCGVFGHKPSFGIISERGYLDRVGGGQSDLDINVFGPLARSAADLDVLLGILAGPHAEDAVAWRLQLPPPRHHDLPAYRIGIWLDDPAAEVDAEVAKVLSAAAAALGATGARVEEAHPAVDLQRAKRLFDRLVQAAISISVRPQVGDPLSGSHRSWLELDQVRAGLRSLWAEWFTRYDVLLCPVMPMAAFPHDDRGKLGDRTVTINGRPRNHSDTMAWTGLVGLVYLPATVVPVGRTVDGLPVGMQVVGPYLEDRTALWIAARLAEVTGGYVPPPGL
jgi:amidase